MHQAAIKKNDFTSVDQNKVQENLPETESVNSIENQETEEKKSVPIIPSNPYKDVPKKIDLDFTKMNYNMASSVIFEMLIEPEKYLNKTVKIDGQFETSVYEGNRYFAVINWDLTGCCPSGLNFIPPDSMIYPYDFPEAGAFVTVTGTMKEAFNGKSNELYFLWKTVRNPVLDDTFTAVSVIRICQLRTHTFFYIGTVHSLHSS
ncbi:MAG: hypothetical protein MSA27_07050 [Spirochaetia bacterium]|nr:hypothetical protein [Spirochaetia bacterium]